MKYFKSILKSLKNYTIPIKQKCILNDILLNTSRGVPRCYLIIFTVIALTNRRHVTPRNIPNYYCIVHKVFLYYLLLFIQFTLCYMCRWKAAFTNLQQSFFYLQAFIHVNFVNVIINIFVNSPSLLCYIHDIYAYNAENCT